MSRALIIVHGAGKPMKDYFKPNVAALKAILGQEPVTFPVWYGDVMNIGAPVFGPADAKAQAFRLAFKAQVEAQMQTIKADKPAVAAFGIGDQLELIADLVADVTSYLHLKIVQKKVQDRLMEQLKNATAHGGEVVLVSHSLGTVVAYDVLRAVGDKHHVSHFITMGSPLLKVAVTGRRPTDVGKIANPPVKVWRNFYDTTDPVANPIKTAFPGYPIEDVFTDNAIDPVGSHNYWSRPKVLQMIADLLK